MSDTGLRRPDIRQLGPEAELLLACARLYLTHPMRDRILELVRGPLDWTNLVALAERHGLRPLLHRHIESLAPDAVPPPIFKLLWAWTERTRSRNRAMAKELLRLLALLDAKGIPALPYKGPALAVSIYGDLALREFGDLDVLVRQEDMPGAIALLIEQGLEPAYALRPVDQAELIHSPLHYHLALIHPVSSLMVELHWMTDLDFPVEAMSQRCWWTRTPELALEQGRVRAFTAPELLLILCLHGSKHHWMSLGWLVDVAELIRQHPDMRWECVLQHARTHGCARRLALGLHLADLLLDAPVPSRVLQRIANISAIHRLSGEVMRNLFDAQSTGKGRLAALRLDLALYDARRLRWRHLLRVIFAPSIKEWLWWRRYRGLQFLAYPARIIRLACRSASAIFKP